MPTPLTRRRALRTLAAFPLAAHAAQSRAQSTAPVDPQLRVLFFNTHLLPAIAQTVAGHRGQDDYRASAIAARLAPYDVVGLCEVFEANRREQIIATLQKTWGQAFHWVESPHPTLPHIICGGLLLVSRFPIEGEPHVLTYAKASNYLTSGLKADKFASKGVIHARLLVGAEPNQQLIDCFLTHLESVSAKARADQVRELSEFIAKHTSPSRLAILMGDLNVGADFPVDAGPADSEYRQLCGALRQSNEPLIDLWPSVHNTRGGTNDALANEDCRRIDDIFLSPRGERATYWDAADVRVEPFLDKTVKQGSLSDHAGLACILTIRPSP